MRGIILLGLLVSSLAPALLVEKTAIDKKLAEASLIADIEVLSIENFSDPVFFARHVAAAQIESITKIVNSDFPHLGDVIYISGIGGEWDGNGIMLSGYPRLHASHRYKAFLNRNNDGTYSITGFDFGLIPITQARAATRNRTDGSNGEGDGAFLFWDENTFPIPYFISAHSFKNSAHLVSGVEAGFRPWRDAEDTKLEFLPMGCSATDLNENDGINNIILVKENWKFDSSAIAITRNFYVAGTSSKSGLILDSDILLNAVNHSFTVSGEASKHDVQNIVTHEVGHFIGLGHEAAPIDTESTMFALASTGEIKKRSLATNDLTGLRAGYSGVGTKFPNTTLSCTIQENAGCASVHGRTFLAGSALFLAGFMLVLLLTGRFLILARS